MEKKECGYSVFKKRLILFLERPYSRVTHGKYCCNVMFGSVYLDVCECCVPVCGSSLSFAVSHDQEKIFPRLHACPWKGNAPFTLKNPQPCLLPPPLPVSAALALPDRTYRIYYLPDGQLTNAIHFASESLKV